jgi:ribonuclease E
MKKLVLFVVIGAAVALSACKKEAPAAATDEPQIETPAAPEAPVTEEAPVNEEAPATDETPATEEVPAQ